MILSLESPAPNGLDTGGLLKLGQNLLTSDNELNIARPAHLPTRESPEKKCFTITDAHNMTSTFRLTYLMKLTTAMEIRKRRPVIDYEPYSAICYLSGNWPFHVEQWLSQQKGPDLPELLISFLRTS